MSAEDEERFQLSNKCCASNNFFDVGDNKVRDHGLVAGKYRGSAHWSCNAKLKLTKNVPVIFHNLRGYDSHLIMQEIDKFHVKLNVIPNLLQLTITCYINNNDFKYLLEEPSGDFLNLVKQEGVYPFEYMASFEKFSGNELSDKYDLFSSLKDGISEKDYLHAMMFLMFFH